MASVSASAAADALLAEIELLGGGSPCPVVAHSMGGAVVTVAAEKRPELFDSVTYVSAFAPVSGISALDYLTSEQAADSVVLSLLTGDPAESGASRLDLGSDDLRNRVQSAFYHDVDDRTAEAAIDSLSHDAPLAMATEPISVTRERFGSIQHSYLTCDLDKIVPPALQKRFVAELDTVSVRPTTVVNLHSSHSPFLSCPGMLADALQESWRRARDGAVSSA